MANLIICRGLPASGKSTWAKEYVKKHPNAVLINRDTLRLNNPGHGEGYIRTMRDDLLKTALQAGYDAISDDTNLIPKTFDALVELAKGCNAGYVIQDFTHISVEECVKRDAARTPSVGEKVVRSFVRFLNAAKRQPINNPVHGLPSAILCDLDGTLALFTNRGPFETAKCESDALSIPVANILQAMRDMYLDDMKDLRIILMSGREEKFRPNTERWLKKHDVFFNDMYMRTTGDKRKDAIVKRELFDANIANKYNILFVLDDRDQVVRMWRDDLNLVVLQVADGNF
jgi:predicted kinase